MQSKEVLYVLLEAAQGLELLGDGFRANAYYKGIDALRGHDLTNLSESELRQLPGVGKSIAQSVQEIFATGTCHRLTALRTQGVPSVSSLLKVQGVGPSTARSLWRKHNITTIGKLLSALENGTLVSDPVLIRRIKKALATSERIPHEAMEQALKTPLAKLKKLQFIDRLEVAGSIRRKASTVKDADLLLCMPKTKANLQALVVACQRIFGRVSGGETKLQTAVTIGGINYNVDILVVEEESWGAALNYFTGSALHNIWIRAQAKAQGLKVNEYGVWKGTKNLGGCEEKDLFKLLNITWVKPEDRVGGPY